MTDIQEFDTIQTGLHFHTKLDFDISVSNMTAVIFQGLIHDQWLFKHFRKEAVKMAIILAVSIHPSIHPFVRRHTTEPLPPAEFL
jgi:hypothetical protein